MYKVEKKKFSSCEAFYFFSVHQTGEEVGKVKDKRTSQKYIKKNVRDI